MGGGGELAVLKIKTEKLESRNAQRLGRSFNAINVCMSGSTYWRHENASIGVETCSPYCY